MIIGILLLKMQLCISLYDQRDVCYNFTFFFAPLLSF